MMNGPSAQALREGGVGGSLRYKTGFTIMVRISNGGPLPSEWKKKTTLQMAFGDYGQILRIDVADAQGVAYIEYDDKRDAEDAARDMDRKTVSGQTISVQVLSSASSLNARWTGGGDIQTRITEMARKNRLDEAATARLVSVFTERVRMGCDLNRDIAELTGHLEASNKPSALVSMKLAELRSGQPIGPCKYRSGKDEKPTSKSHEGGGSRGGSIEEGRSTRGGDRGSGRRGEGGGNRGGTDEDVSGDRRNRRDRSRGDRDRDRSSAGYRQQSGRTRDSDRRDGGSGYRDGRDDVERDRDDAVRNDASARDRSRDRTRERDVAESACEIRSSRDDDARRRDALTASRDLSRYANGRRRP
eukprot:TRINITY_DN50230_c0_g1_i1.p1 TRINITY_DN50230_c0_g1~~TRINITY_DN50230_c0_g1_i1.p1  ORF type:complete len:359 (-),score=60.09 TRINITY_DN50230_c0_g1_i1:93-1169(-)